MSSSKVIIQVQPAGGGDWKPLIWRNVKIKKSLDEICHSLELELPSCEKSKIHRHDKIEVRLYNPFITDSQSKRRVSTMLVDEIIDSADASQKNITVAGRSPARDIIDSSWTDRIEGSPSLESIVKHIAGKFSIEATRMPTNSAETGPVASFSWDSESPWTKLLNEAANQGYLFTSNEAGGLYLARAGLHHPGFFLTESQNIRSMQTTETGAEQYHEYVVSGNGVTAREIDDTCKNNRILTINITEEMVAEETLKRRALTEMRRRKETRSTVTVTGWGLSDEQIKSFGDTNQKELFWNPNFLIPVKIPSIGLDDRLLISEVNYEADQSSMTCRITLVNQEVYQ